MNQFLGNARDAYLTDVDCDWSVEETCYDGNWTAVSCARYDEGGCPCPEGDEKCGAEIEFGWPGWCTPICCDWETEETCYDENGMSCAKYSDGGCPCAENQTKCGAFEGYPGYCTDLCCDGSTEETCYDENYSPVSCAKIDEGGCACPDGEEKCGANVDFGWPGYCTDLCCGFDEETCYDESYSPVSCANIAEGGCPCPDGEEKCGADVVFGWAGYCTALCCNWETEETCYDENWYPISCAKYDEGGCPFNTRYDHRKSQITAFIQTKGGGKDIALFHAINNRKEKVLERGSSKMSAIEQMTAVEEIALFHAITLRESNALTKTSGVFSSMEGAALFPKSLD